MKEPEPATACPAVVGRRHTARPAVAPIRSSRKKPEPEQASKPKLPVQRNTESC